MSKKRKERVKSLADASLFAKRIIAIMLAAVMLMSGVIPMPVESSPVQVQAAAKAPVLQKTGTLKIGQKARLTLKNAIANQIKWSSDNENIVTISKTGYVYGVNAGITNVTAEYKNKKYTCRITVLEVSISQPTAHLGVKKSGRLSLKNAYGSIKWSTSDKTIVSVSSSGTVRGVKEGIATVTATNQGRQYTCRITVVDINKQTDQAINDLIKTAQGEIGYCEKRSNKNLDSKTANTGYNNYTKYARDVDNYYQGDPWCAIFISWCMKETYGLSTAKKILKDWPYVACRCLMWYLPTYKTPKKGDIVIFYTDGGYNHTGIVTKVQGPKFWTIEGNTKKVNEVVSNGYCVCEKSYYLKSVPRVRFCRPNYQLAV